METELVLELPNDLRQIEHVVEYVMERCAACEMHGRKVRLNFRVSLTEDSVQEIPVARELVTLSRTPCCTATTATPTNGCASR